MKNKKNILERGRNIKADLYSRPNAINGKYRAAEIELDNIVGIKDKDIFFLETLRMKADLADKMIAEAESQGRDTTDLKVLKKLGEEINTQGTPLHRREAIISGIFVSLQLMVYYGIAIGIWGLVFEKSILVFGFFGVIVGLLISLLSAGPVVAYQRTKEQIKEIVFGISVTLVNFAILIGFTGLVVWIIKLIFF